MSRAIVSPRRSRSRSPGLGPSPATSPGAATGSSSLDARLDLVLANVGPLTRPRPPSDALAARASRGKDGAPIDHIELFGPARSSGATAATSSSVRAAPTTARRAAPAPAPSSPASRGRQVAPGEVWVQESIIGSRFRASFEPGPNGGVLPRISGRAFVCAESKLVEDPGGPVPVRVRRLAALIPCPPPANPSLDTILGLDISRPESPAPTPNPPSDPKPMPDNSFDVVSKIELPEVNNAVQQALKEIQQRYDLKDSHSNIELNEKDNKILLASEDEFKLKAVIEILEPKLVKRKVPLKGLIYGEIIPAAGSTVQAGNHAAAGHPHREGARDRQEDQGQQEEGAGVDSGRLRARRRQGSRHAAGGDQAAARAAISASTCSSPTTGPTEVAAPHRIAFDLPGPPGGWKRCWKSRRTRRRATRRWSAIRIRSTAAPCTTRWSTAWPAACARAGRRGAALQFSRRGRERRRARALTGEIEDARAALAWLRARYPDCRSRWPAFPSARA